MLSPIRKKLLLASVPFLALVLLVGGYYYFKHASAKAVLNVTATEPAAPVADLPKEQTALLTKESGEIEYKLPGEPSFVALTQNTVRVPSGTSIRTGKKSLGHVLFPNNSLMSLSSETQLILNFEDKKITVQQLLGNTWHRVAKVLEGSSYSVETPNTLASVRGTEFNVRVLANKRSVVDVVESVVEVSKVVYQEGGKVVVQDTKTVTQNQHVVVPEKESTVPLKVEPLPKETKQTDWFQRNIEITEQIEEVAAAAAVTEEGAQDAPDSPTKDAQPDQNAAPSESEQINLDIIKQVIIENIMENIQDNTELEKIDQNEKLEKIEEITKSEVSESNLLETEFRIDLDPPQVQGVTDVFTDSFGSPTNGAEPTPDSPTRDAEPSNPTETPVEKVQETVEPQPTVEEVRPTDVPQEEQRSVQEAPREEVREEVKEVAPEQPAPEEKPAENPPSIFQEIKEFIEEMTS